MDGIIQKFYFQKELNLFDYEENVQKHFSEFLKTSLGKIWLAIPWSKLVQTFDLKKRKNDHLSIFSDRGKLALMFLKSYEGVSDRKLIEQLNGNIYYQIFCGIDLSKKKLKNYKIVSHIRCELAEKLNIKEVQKELIKYWSPYIKHKHVILMDATCYESDVRYPTDQKLLWESIEWTYNQIKKLSKYLKINRPRTKYLDIKNAYLTYSKTRKKTYKKRKKITKRMLDLLEKLFPILENISIKESISLNKKDEEKIQTIKKVLDQQKTLFSGEEVSQRIVSISKSYLRPIVRGKEKKRIEVGAKVNKVQIDGIDIIEKIDFENYNESCNYESSIEISEELTGESVKQTGADSIYATNKNRSYANQKTIYTDFVRKGRAGKNEKQRKILAKAIRKERSTRLEGSFGVDKRHYGLERVKAKKKETEILWIFFGIQTKNSLEIGRRKIDEKEKKRNLERTG